MKRTGRSIGGVLLGLALPVCASAGIITPTRFDDPAPDGCLPADCSLREAVILANAAPGPDTIVLGIGDYQVTLTGASEEFAYTGDLDVTDPLEIIGAGRDLTSIVAVALGDRILDETGAPLTLRNLTVSGGNHAFTGGGIRSLIGLTIEDGRVSDNTTVREGGGVWAWRNLTLTRTEITDNGAVRGGGLFLEFTPSPPAMLSFTDVTVAANQGTGMTLTGPMNATLVRTDVRANQGHGIDIFAARSSSINVVAGTLEANAGAGIRLRIWPVSSAKIDVSLQGTVVQDNMMWGLTAEEFEGVSSDELHVTVKDAVFRRNQVGARIAVNPSVPGVWLRFDRTTFADNTGDEGAALRVNGRAFVFRSRFEGNQSTGSGGAIVVGNYEGSFGPGPGYLVVRNSSFEGNVSGADGGAIHVATRPSGSGGFAAIAADIAATSFVGNTAAGNGGAVSVPTRDANLRLVTFSGNQAGSFHLGGGLYVGNAAVSVSESTFRANTVESGGAGTAIGFAAQGEPGPLTLSDTIVSGSCAFLLPPTDLGDNIESPAGGCFPTPATGTQVNVSDVALELGPLTAGTWTSFHEPQVGSLAIDAASGCGPTDQRGFVRVDGLCDVGAIETGALDEVIFRDGFQ